MKLNRYKTLEFLNPVKTTLYSMSWVQYEKVLNGKFVKNHFLTDIILEGANFKLTISLKRSLLRFLFKVKCSETLKINAIKFNLKCSNNETKLLIRRQYEKVLIQLNTILLYDIMVYSLLVICITGMSTGTKFSFIN